MRLMETELTQWRFDKLSRFRSFVWVEVMLVTPGLWMDVPIIPSAAKGKTYMRFVRENHCQNLAWFGQRSC